MKTLTLKVCGKHKIDFSRGQISKGGRCYLLTIAKRFNYLIGIFKCYHALLVFLGTTEKMHLN